MYTALFLMCKTVCIYIGNVSSHPVSWQEFSRFWEVLRFHPMIVCYESIALAPRVLQEVPYCYRSDEGLLSVLRPDELPVRVHMSALRLPCEPPAPGFECSPHSPLQL